MEEGETLSFSADEELELTVADGGAVQVTVAGATSARPESRARRGRETFTFDVRPSLRRAASSPAP